VHGKACSRWVWHDEARHGTQGGYAQILSYEATGIPTKMPASRLLHAWLWPAYQACQHRKFAGMLCFLIHESDTKTVLHTILVTVSRDGCEKHVEARLRNERCRALFVSLEKWR